MEKQNTDAVTFSNDKILQAILESESSILENMGKMFSTDSKEKGQMGFIQLVSSLERSGGDFLAEADRIKTFLCALACKECAIADILNAIACLRAVDRNLISDESTCCECK